MKLNRTIVGFNGGTSPFTTLTTDNLDAVQSAFVMRTDLNKADKLVINKSATGHDNSIWVNFLKNLLTRTRLIFHWSAHQATADNLFRASTRVGSVMSPPTLVSEKRTGKKSGSSMVTRLHVTTARVRLPPHSCTSAITTSSLKLTT